MQTTANPPSLVAADSHLKLHLPEPPCPFDEALEHNLPGFRLINESFQRATGWSLAFRESPTSRRRRRTANCPNLPALGKLEIDDMSPLLPPGKPAVSRRHCDAFVDALNWLVDELQATRRQLWNQRGTDYLAEGHSSKLESTNDLADPLTIDQVSVLPLTDNAGNLAYQWHFDQSQRINVAVFRADPRCPQWTAGMLVAKTAARCFGVESLRAAEILSRINDVIFQSFTGDLQLDSLLLQINPLTGSFGLSGCGAIEVWQSRATGPHQHALESFPLGTEPNQNYQELSGYLPVKEHLVVASRSIQSTSVEEDPESSRSIRDLVKGVCQSFSRKTAEVCVEIYEKQISERIPRVTHPPENAILISRI